MRRVLAFCALTAVLATGATTATAQTRLDRLVSRVNGVAITQTDVSQARMLKLVADTSSDAAAQRELENRILILGELSRAGGLDPIDDAAVAARRRQWEAALGAPAADLMARADMNEKALVAWLRDDLRTGAFLQRQFGDRTAAKNEWIARLRERAGLR
jgi:hypothetical protein